MDSVTISRRFETTPDTIRDAMNDIGQFTKAAGFDDVTVDGTRIDVANQVGVTTIELTLRLLENYSSDLAYEQQKGIFEEMTTEYEVSETEDGSKVTATTVFALDVALVGDVLDSTIIKRQRQKELTAQFDWLEQQVVD
jgi:hypothetical protein